jgi:hypothetical protein
LEYSAAHTHDGGRGFGRIRPRHLPRFLPAADGSVERGRVVRADGSRARAQGRGVPAAAEAVGHRRRHRTHRARGAWRSASRSPARDRSRFLEVAVTVVPARATRGRHAKRASRDPRPPVVDPIFVWVFRRAGVSRRTSLNPGRGIDLPSPPRRSASARNPRRRSRRPRNPRKRAPPRRRRRASERVSTEGRDREVTSHRPS